METILSSPLVMAIILPFVLVFVVVFALLQKTKIFGEGKKQIDALVALVIGLVLVSFGKATGMIINLIPFLAVSLIVILVFMILWGSVFHPGEFEIPKGVRWAFGIIIAIAVIIAVLVVTPGWDYLIGLFGAEAKTGLVTNVILIIAVIAAVIIVVVPGGEKKKSAKEGE